VLKGGRGKRKSFTCDHLKGKSTKYTNNTTEDLHKINNESELARIRSLRDSLKFLGMPRYQRVVLKWGREKI